MSLDWIRQQFASLTGSEDTPGNRRRPQAEDLLSPKHDDGRPIGPNTMRLRLRTYAERAAWVAERRAEAAERVRQEAERRRYRIQQLDDEVQVQREFQRLRRASGG